MQTAEAGLCRFTLPRREIDGLTEPERLPPPPFWRTRYFAFDILARRDYLDPIEIQRIIRRPEHRQVQADGQIRLWGYAASLAGYLRVVLLADGETVHNAFYDEDYRP
jgi:hypothetical protein